MNDNNKFKKLKNWQKKIIKWKNYKKNNKNENRKIIDKKNWEILLRVENCVEWLIAVNMDRRKEGPWKR